MVCQIGQIDFTIINFTVILAKDFYELLGVSNSASTKEIRKAFKKLAITKHPDKNKDDPDAHENFLRITKAYEVLKDDELRKKYDTHGEEGLRDDYHGGGQYQSWKIYDEDNEIITLSRADFEQSVENTDDIWFVNFYSPHCSHCHELAPTWREVARELEGVIRIGAVNCEDDWQLCRMQRIHSYPSLIMYPAREKYHGTRSQKEMVKYALKQVTAKVIDLWSGNFGNNIKDSSKPWLITFCGDGGDCLKKSTCIKLSAILEELVNVGTMSCHSNDDLCEKLGLEHGTYFFEAGRVKKGKGLEITSLVAQEIAKQVLSQLPDVANLNQEVFKNILKNLKTGQEDDWLIHFVEGEDHQDIEFRKLKAMLEGIKIGRVDCRVMRTECNSVHVHSFPSFILVKETGGYEIYYGRMTAHDVAAFARDSAGIKVESLDPSDFDNQRVGPNSKEPWFIDFFAPWCPPCMRLLPEFRKAAKNFGNVIHFGTVDCTIHQQLCRMYNIRSYPTTILYNRSVPHQYHGHHSASNMVEFIQDTLSPPVIILNDNNFDELVKHKEQDVVWLMLKNTKNIKVGQVDCQEHSYLCQRQHVNSYPSMRLFPSGTTGSGSHHIYNGWHRDAESLRAWAFEFLPSKVETLGQGDFQRKVLNSQRPWLVDFYAPWCGHCQVFKPEFEKVAEVIFCYILINNFMLSPDITLQLYIVTRHNITTLRCHQT
ncbi:hypothetical protein KUTeg_002278 [Tegillarca granosa]|uniref:DnaJ homolog subfamily C member 10 n=1 Tax=Tegillarca granosa TaxID=220873 RepID=A0ABQ9FTV7_TEGGR|nr:hypothetical protein KUTeg_002278 [Tegillarca granosa]